MSESFEDFKKFAKGTDSLPEADRFDALDRGAVEKLGGVVLTEYDLQFEKAVPTIERKLKSLTVTSETTPQELAVLQQQLFAPKHYDFLYENKRIKSIEVLCRQLREVLTIAGMSETDIHTLFSGELSPVINQLATYEKVPVPKAEQAQEEMSLRSRLLSTATARFFATTKLKPIEVTPVPRVSVPATAATIPQSEKPGMPDTTAEASKVSVSDRVYENMEDQAKLATADYDEQQTFIAANRVAPALQESPMATVENSAASKPEESLSNGDNTQSTAGGAGTISQEPMSPETSKIIASEEQRTAPLANEAIAFVSPDERSVASLMAQADRLIALTKKRRERLDLSHRAAKEDSDNYAAIRSEITKIKNRLRAIVEEKNVVQKREEITELRSLLAGHLWALRKDFPITGAENVPEGSEGMPEDTDSLAEEKAEAVRALKEQFDADRKPVATELVAGASVLITLPDGSRVQGEIELIHDNGTTVAVSWQEAGVRKMQVVPRTSVEVIDPAEGVHDDGIPLSQFSGTDTLAHAAEVAAKAGSTPEAQVASAELSDYVEPNLEAILSEPEYVTAARERGADVSPQASIEVAVKAAREKLDEKIAATAGYRNSILAGTEDDRLMTLKHKLQTLEARLESAKAAPSVTRPEEVQAFRSQLADVEYALNQLEATAPKKLLGLPVPRATDGPFAVRAFRDALNLEWQPFKRVAEKSTDAEILRKKQAFEGVFKILGYVPESGLTEGEASELRRLVEVIALPARISGEFVPKTNEATVATETKKEVLPPLVLTERMRVREEAVAGILKEKLPAVAEREIDPKHDAKARRWFAGFGALAIGGVLLGLFGGDDTEKKSVTSGKSPLETAGPAAPGDVPEPTITVKPEVKPIEGRWPSGDSVRVTDTAPTERSEIEPTITDITDRVTAEGERAPDYTVKASDNLWDFAEGGVEDREPLAPLNGLTELQKSLVLNDMVTALKYSPERMRDLGLRSGNPNLIFPGEVIKTQVLIDLLNEIKRDRKLA